MFSASQINAGMAIAGFANQFLQYQAARERAKSLEIQSRWAEIQGIEEKARLRREANRYVGEATAAAYHSGFSASDFTDVVADSYSRLALDEDKIDRNVRAAVVSAYGNAAAVRAEASLAAVGGVLGVAGNYAMNQHTIDQNRPDNNPQFMVGTAGARRNPGGASTYTGPSNIMGPTGADALPRRNPGGASTYQGPDTFQSKQREIGQSIRQNQLINPFSDYSFLGT